MHKRPLQGKRIVVTRPEAQAGGLAARLRELGAEPIACPAIAIAPPSDFAPLDTAIARLDRYDRLIVTSANGVRALLARMAELGRDIVTLDMVKQVTVETDRIALSIDLTTPACPMKDDIERDVRTPFQNDFRAQKISVRDGLQEAKRRIAGIIGT